MFVDRFDWLVPARFRDRSSGFTLVELIAVIVIVGILAALATVSYRAVIGRSEDSRVLVAQQSVAREVAAILSFDDGTSPEQALLEAVNDLPDAAVPGVFVDEGAGSGWVVLPDDGVNALGEKTVLWSVAADADSEVLGWKARGLSSSVVECEVTVGSAQAHGCWMAGGAEPGDTNEEEEEEEDEGSHDFSVEPPAATHRAGGVPGDPAAVMVQGSDIRVEWVQVADTPEAIVTGYRISASVDGGPVETVATTAKTRTWYNIVDPEPGDWCVTVAVQNAAGMSPETEEECVTVTEPGEWASVFSRGTITGNPNNLRFTSGGSYACAIDVAGEVFCWGNPSGGVLGYGSVGSTTSFELTPALVPIDGHVTKVTGGGSHVCALTAEQTIWCWGNGSDRRLGTPVDPTAPYGIVPRQVFGEHDWIDVDANANRTCAINTNHDLFCWGSGFLGNGGSASTSSSTLVPVAAGKHWESVAVGNHHTCGIASDGAFCWGQNSNTQLGIGVGAAQGHPAGVTNSDHTYLTIAPLKSGNTTCGLTDGNEVYCWGHAGAANHPVLGDGGATTASTTAVPVQVLLPEGVTILSLHTGGYGACAETDVGIYCWGSKTFVSVADPQPTPILIQTGPVDAYAPEPNHFYSIVNGHLMLHHGPDTLVPVPLGAG